VKRGDSTGDQGADGIRGAGLLEEDLWMMEVNLGDLGNTSGKEAYWLLVIKAVRVAATLAG
jgi:hypothetical protein